MADEPQVLEKITPVRPANIPSIYINNAQVTLGLLEIRLHLGEVAPGPENTVFSTERLCLILAPEFAKFMAERLLKVMDQYENQFGKLRRIQAEEVPSKTAGSAGENS